MQQALEYAATLDIPFVFSSNGDGFAFHDRTGSSTEKEANLGLGSHAALTAAVHYFGGGWSSK
jgi:type I site-specific restriction endonuclease